jgi:ADP-ribosyl-[dinitrogen reductase] hydrolase
MADIPLQSRFRGALLGLAAGDALGTTVEFSPPGSFEPLEDIVGGGPFRLNAGEWTDDTSMALCLAESLVERREFDPADQMQRYLRWRTEGYLSSNGRCVDCGNTVSAALDRFRTTGDPMAGSKDPDTAGNGSLMRLAPVPLFFSRNPDRAVELAGESSKTTHGAAEAVDACRFYAHLMVLALAGKSKNEILSGSQELHLSAKVANVAAGSYWAKRAPRGGVRSADEVRGTGYVVDSLEAALWAFNMTDDFRSGCLAAANLGDDADTTAAVYGQLAGAFYGEDGIPRPWRDTLAKKDSIVHLADRLLDGRA